MKSKWEEDFDKTLIPAIGDVMNTLYQESMINGRLSEGYMNHCTGLIKEKASNYIDGKLNALFGIDLDIKNRKNTQKIEKGREGEDIGISILLNVMESIAIKGYEECKIISSDSKLYSLIGNGANDSEISDKELGKMVRKIVNITDRLMKQKMDSIQKNVKKGEQII